MAGASASFSSAASVKLTASSALDGVSVCVLGAIVQLDKATAAKQIVLHVQDTAAGNQDTAGLEIQTDGASGYWLTGYRFTGPLATDYYRVRSPAASIPVGVPLHVAVRYGAAGAIALFINGSPATLTTVSGAAPASWPSFSASTLYVGSYRTGASPLDGLIAEVVVFDTALANAAILDMHGPTRKLAQAVYMADFSVGVLGASTGTIDPSLQETTHPAIGLTAVKDSGPTPAGGTITAVGGGWTYDATGAASGGAFSFTGHVTKGSPAVSSAVRTISGNWHTVGTGVAGEFAARFPATAAAPAANVWVAPGGSAAYPGTQAVPMGSISDAIRAAQPGDVIAVRANQGSYTTTAHEVRNQTFTNLNFAANPITVIGWGSTSQRAVIDLSIQKFRGGTPASPTNAWTSVAGGLDIWEEISASSPAGETHGFYFGSGEKLALLAYADSTAFTDTSYTSSTRYCGPGLFTVSGKIRIRTETAFWSSFTGHGDVPSNKNPNQQDIIVFSNDNIFTFNDCRGIHFQFIEFQHCLRAVEIQDACDDITFTDCVFSGQFEYIRCDLEGDTGNAANIQFHYCDIGRFLPRYIAYYDWKADPNSIIGLNGRGDILLRGDPGNSARFPDAWRFQNCWFAGTQQAFFLAWRVRGLEILNCVFDGERDDAVTVAQAVENFEFAYNYLKSYGLGIGRHNASDFNADPGSVYIHHNIIDCGRRHNRFTTTVEGTAFFGTRYMLGHGITMSSLPEPFTMKVYYNTIIVNGDEDGAGGVGHEYRDSWTNSNNLADAQEAYNNIIVQLDDWQFLRDCGARDAFVTDGSCYYRPSGSSNKFVAMDESNLNRSFSNLAALKADTTFIDATKTLYSPGMENSGIETNPNFTGGSTFPMGAISGYRPTTAAVKTGAVNITSRGFPGASVYQAWRGALEPDGTGSEVGIQS